jgi:hypothetical protein
MPSLYTFDDRLSGNSVAPAFNVTQSADGNTTDQPRMRPRNCRTSLLILLRLFALLLAFAVTPTMTFAQKSDSDRDREKANDLTGAWLLTVGDGVLVVQNYMKDGNLLSSSQGESGPLPTLGTAGHGVWKKTGAKTFESTFVTIVYEQDTTLDGILTINSTGTLNDSGDKLQGNSIGVFRAHPNGNVLQTIHAPFSAQRIPVGFTGSFTGS